MKGQKMTPQAFILRQAKQKAGKITWKEIASRINSTERALKSYLAPDGSTNFRTMPEEVFAKLEEVFGPSVQMMNSSSRYHPFKKVISVSAQKGGVGKTTIVSTLGSIYAKMGYKVLVIDMDPQANLTEQYFVEDEDFPAEIEPEIDGDTFSPGPAHVWNMFVGDTPVHPYPINDKLHLIGSSLDLAEIMGQDLSVVDHFNHSLDTLKDDYDLIILDTLPSFGNILASAHRAADWLVIPTELARFSKKGIRLQAQTANNTVQHFGHDLQLLGILVNKAVYINRSQHKLLKIQDAYLSSLVEQYDDAILQPIISSSPQVSESQLMARSIIDYAPSSEVAIQFTALANELMNRIELHEGNANG